MSINQPILEKSEQPLVLENCTDPNISQEQINALEEQSVNVAKGMVRIAGAKVRYTHLAPEHPTDEPGIVIANGYWATDGAYSALAAELAIRGRTVTHIKPPRTQGIVASVRPEHLKDVLLLQAQALWAVMKVQGEDQYDIYGHSMGAPIAARVANEKQERVHSLLLAGGAGMNGKNGFLGMLIKSGGLLHHDVYAGRRDLRRYTTPSIVTDTLIHGLRRPDRTLREGVTVAREDIRPRLERVKEAGISIGALLFDEDIFFTSGSILAATGDLLDVVHRTPGASHVYPQDHPLQHANDIISVSDTLYIRATHQQSA